MYIKELILSCFLKYEIAAKPNELVFLNLFILVELIPQRAIDFFFVFDAKRLNFIVFRNLFVFFILNIGDMKIN